MLQKCLDFLSTSRTDQIHAQDIDLQPEYQRGRVFMARMLTSTLTRSL